MRNYQERAICIAFENALKQYHSHIYKHLAHIKNESTRAQTLHVRAGMPDYWISVARGGWHGLYIEFKRPKGRLSAAQKTTIIELRNENYQVHVAYDYATAVDICVNYFNL